MKTTHAVRRVLLGATLVAAVSTASSAWGQQRFRSSGKTPSEPAPTVELTMPTAEPSAGSAVPPWERPMHVPGSGPSAPAPQPDPDTRPTSAAPGGLDIQIDLPNPAERPKGDKHKSDLAKTDKAKADKAKAEKAKSDKAKADKTKADKAWADKTKKPSSASRLAKSHAADSSDAAPGGSTALGTSSAAAGSTKKPWLGATPRRGPDEPESASLRDRIRRARTDTRERTASLPPQASANLR